MDLYGKRLARSDKIYNAVNAAILIIILLIVAYPLYFIIIASISNPAAVSIGDVILWPLDINLDGYGKILDYPNIWVGYRNSLIYTGLGSFLSVSITIACGFAFSRRTVPFRNILLTFFIIPMFFGGGIVPTYLIISDLKLVNKPILLIILGCVNMYNIVIAKTYITSTLPEELYESAHMDGCGDLRYLVSIVVPLSKALLSVQMIFAISNYWNSYFNAMIYITNDNYKPLSLVIRRVLIDSDWSMNESMNIGQVGSDAARAQQMMLSVKYCVFIVSSLPLMIAYPFAQKYFVKGMMIGSVKG